MLFSSLLLRNYLLTKIRISSAPPPNYLQESLEVYSSILQSTEIHRNFCIGSKHWPLNKQNALWDWLTPFFKKLTSGLKTDTLVIWTSFLEVRVKL